MTRAVILVAPGFQDEEFVYPYYRIQEAGWHWDVAAATERTMGKYGIVANATKNFAQLEKHAYDVVLIPGGYECPDRLRMNTAAVKFVKDMFLDGRLVAAICHGPWVCISAGIVRGQRVTGYQSLADDLENAGGEYISVPVVESKNLITCQHYKYNGEFMRQVIDFMQHRYYGERHAI